jgi:small subunit ribosomal protein S18
MMSDEQNPTTEETTPVVESTDSTMSESTTAEPNPSEISGSELAASETTMQAVTSESSAEEESAGVESDAPALPATGADSAPVAAPVAPPPAPPPAAEENVGPREYAGEQEGGGRGRRTSVDARYEDVHYKNVPLLSRFLDPRGRILSRRKTRVSAKVQRRVVKSIKWARHLALLPYTAEQTRIVRRRR